MATKQLIFVTEAQLAALNQSEWIGFDATTNTMFKSAPPARVFARVPATILSLDIVMELAAHPDLVDHVCSFIRRERRVGGAMHDLAGIAVVCANGAMASQLRTLCAMHLATGTKKPCPARPLILFFQIMR